MSSEDPCYQYQALLFGASFLSGWSWCVTVHFRCALTDNSRGKIPFSWCMLPIATTRPVHASATPNAADAIFKAIENEIGSFFDFQRTFPRQMKSKYVMPSCSYKPVDDDGGTICREFPEPPVEVLTVRASSTLWDVRWACKLDIH